MMKTRWETSKRPLFVKSVWVNGLRHTILSPDDPLLKCSTPPKSRRSSCTSNTISPRVKVARADSNMYNDLEGCLIQLQIVIEDNKPLTREELRIAERQINGKRSVSFNEVDNYHCNMLSSFDESETYSLKSCDRENVICNLKHQNKQFATLDEYPMKQNDEVSLIGVRENSGRDSYSDRSQLEYLKQDENSLSDRVLQWLDLAGSSLIENRSKATKSRKYNGDSNRKRISTAIPLRSTRTKNNCAGSGIINKEVQEIPVKAIKSDANSRIVKDPDHKTCEIVNNPTESVSVTDTLPASNLDFRTNEATCERNSMHVIPYKTDDVDVTCESKRIELHRNQRTHQKRNLQIDTAKATPDDAVPDVKSAQTCQDKTTAFAVSASNPLVQSKKRVSIDFNHAFERCASSESSGGRKGARTTRKNFRRHGSFSHQDNLMHPVSGCSLAFNDDNYMSSSKRQLHIFMPILPKRSVDTGSTLSTISSSL